MELFVNDINQFGIPSCVRSDRGGENVHIWELYFVTFAACNTGIPSFMHKLQQVSNPNIYNLKKSHIYLYSPAPHIGGAANSRSRFSPFAAHGKLVALLLVE